jgi:hypothetical protein
MRKDVIYIDIEDDITNIIGRIKDSSHKIVAIVPPKRAGALASVVNLKLLQKAADSVSKKIVIISQDQQIINLAGGIGIYTAENLQSRPSLSKGDEPNTETDADLEKIVEDDTEALSDSDEEEKEVGSDEESPQNEEEETDSSDNPEPDEKSKKSNKKSKSKIPDFDKFKKKITLIILAVIALIAFLFWAILYAPKAKVTLTAETEKKAFNTTVVLDSTQSQPNDTGTILPSTNLEFSQERSAEIVATGEKNVGKKASGTATISNCSDNDPIGFVSNTALISSSGKLYYTTESVTVPGADFAGGSCSQAGKASVGIIADKQGSTSNVSSTRFTIRAISAAANQAYTVSGSASGGTDEVVKIITQDDINTATAKLLEEDIVQAKAELRKKAQGEVILVDPSFASSHSDPVAKPGVNEQSTKGVVTANFTYKQMAVRQKDIEFSILKNLEQDKKQSLVKLAVLDYGLDNVSLTTGEGVNRYEIKTNVILGPDIDKDLLAKELVKSSYEEAILISEKVKGVSKADIKLSPFWVSKMPRKADSIKIDVKLTGEGSENK